MSVRVMTAVWELNIPVTDKFILLGFADHADDSGFCYPSYGRIAWKCGVSQRTVARCMANFRQSGLVELLEDAHRGHTQRFRIHPNKVAKLAPFTPEGMPTTTGKVANHDIKVATAMATESSVLEPSVNRRAYFTNPRYGELRQKRWSNEHNGTPFTLERAGVR
jgi:phage tail sheath protein FI